MELAVEIRETADYLADYLDEQDKTIILAIMRKFMPLDNVASEEDLRDIAIARKEFEDGTYANWEDVDWD
jgi:hypothetical protein